MYVYVPDKLVVFPNAGEWPFAEDLLCVPAAFSTLFTCGIDSSHSPMWAVWVFLLWQADYVGSLVGFLGSWFRWLPLLPQAQAASCWLSGPGHKAADCEIPGGSGDSAGSLLYGVKVQKTPGL